jgi:two-component system cell cycle sensor histidine kinase/response regulator CckA
MRKNMTARITALVVDDEDVHRMNMSRILRAVGLAVLEASSYSDAMAVFDLNLGAVQLLVAELALPDGNACALAVAMRRQKPDLRVLFVGFHVGSEVCKYYGLRLPNLHFLQKPFKESQLTNRVRSVMSTADSTPVLNAPKTLTASRSV